MILFFSGPLDLELLEGNDDEVNEDDENDEDDDDDEDEDYAVDLFDNILDNTSTSDDTDFEP